MALSSGCALNAHQFSLLHHPHPSLNHHRQTHHSFNRNPLSLFNPNFSQIKSNLNHPKPPSIFLKPLLKPSLISSPLLSSSPEAPGQQPDNAIIWGSFSGVGPGRADLRAWSGRRAGSKGKGKSKRKTVTMECTKCMKNRYITEKHSLNTPEKMELNKYCPHCRIHTTHKEIK